MLIKNCQATQKSFIDRISNAWFTLGSERNHGRLPITVFKSLNDRQSDIFLKFTVIGDFSGPSNHSKISNFTITELFYSHILNMKRCSLHTRSFRRIHFSVFSTDELKITLWARKVSGAFEKRATVLQLLSTRDF